MPPSSGQTTTPIRFTTLPSTRTPASFVADVVELFETHAGEIGTVHQEKGLKSDDVLAVLRPDLVQLGFEVEAGKRHIDKIMRPVFFGENGRPALQYQVDAWQPKPKPR